MNVSEIMTENPVVARPNTPIREALELLQTLDVRHLPVVSEGGDLVGMLSDRDLAAVGQGASPSDSARTIMLAEPVSTVMTGAPVTVLPEEDVVQAIDLLLESKVGALPVVTEETGSLIGILSYVDVLRGLRDEVS